MPITSPRLPAEASALLQRLQRHIRLGQVPTELIQELLSILQALPAEAATEAMDEVRAGARLHLADWREPKQSSARAAVIDLLRRSPGLEWIFLSHSDGFVREAALARIAGPLPSAFFVVALAARLNDWVWQVRAAAQDALVRAVPESGAEPVVQATLFLLERGRTWRRWDEANLEALHAVLGRGDVAVAVAGMIARSPNGPMTRLLGSALRWPAIDPCLPELAREAVQPAVRALAGRVLLRGQASWLSGWQRRWKDKSMGLWEEAPIYDTRRLSVQVEAASLLRSLARDRSGRVRRVAAQALIDLQLPPALVDSLLPIFLTDRDRAVRERVEFILARKSSGV